MSCPVAHGSSASTPDRTSPSQRPAPKTTEGELQEIPQPPTKYFTGNLSELDPSFPAKSFWRLADIYGPIFKLDILGSTSIVLSSYDLISEVCGDQDRLEVFAPAT